MGTGPIKHFLLMYNLDTRELEIEDFDRAGEDAAQAYTDRELEHANDPAIEVVLVGADSIDTIRKTHSHYFPRVKGGLVDELERELTAALGVKY